MKKKICILLITLCVVGIGVLYFQNGKFNNKYPLSLTIENIRNQNEGQIYLEERLGEIFVTVVDKHKDAHVFHVDLGVYSKSEARNIIAKKQLTLQQSKQQEEE